MKRLICFVLMLGVMILTVTITADAAQNNEYDKDYEYQFNVLHSLGFLNEGFTEDNAEEEVTREQALDVIVRMCSFDIDSFRAEEGYTYFFDVDPGSAYFNSISYAAMNGIAIGSDGMFQPKEPVTGIQAIVFLMRALGYSAYAGVNGGYPTGYRKAAKASGLNYSKESTLTKSDFISLMFKAMDAFVCEQTKFGSSITFDMNSETVIEHFHDMFKVKGQVTANFASSLNGMSNNGGLCIGNDNYRIEDAAYNGFLGYYVEAYCRDDDTGLPTILFMAQDPKYDVLMIKADDNVSFSGLKYSYGEGSSKQAKIEVDHNLIVNGVKLTDYSESDFVPENGYIILIGKNRTYDTVIVNTFRNYFIQRMAVGIAKSITLTEYETLRRFEIALNDEDKAVEVYVDNKRVEIKPLSYTVKGEEHDTYTFVDIPAGSGCSIFADKYEAVNGWIVPAKDAQIVKIYVNTPELYGKCVSYYDDHIQIDDEVYEVAEFNYFDDLKLNDSGYFIFDYDGKIFARYNNEYVNDTAYFYLINAKTRRYGEELLLKVITDNGKYVTYNIKNKIKINGKTVKEPEKMMNALSESAKFLDPSFTISQPIKLRFDEYGEISEVHTVSEEDNDEKIEIERKKENFWARSDSNYMLYQAFNGIARYLPPRVIFEVPDTETFNEDDYKVMSTWSPDYGKKLVDIFDVNSYKIPALVVSYVPAGENILLSYLMVEKAATVYDAEEGCVYKEIRGYDGLDKVYFHSDDPELFDELKTGDVIRIYGRGEEVASWTYVCKIDDVINHDFSSSYGKQSSGLYEIYSRNGDNFTLQHDALLPGQSGKRESQIGFLWTQDLQSFIYGSVYYEATQNGGKVSAFRINAGVPNVIQTVRNVGNEESTKIYIIMENGMIKFVALYNGLK